MIKCDQSKCQQGFIIPRKAAGSYCKRILDFNGTEEIEAIDPDSRVLKAPDIKDGFYILQCQTVLHDAKKYFKMTSSGFLTADCSEVAEKPVKLIPQDYPTKLTIEEVRRKLVIQSRIEETINLFMNLLLPMLIALVLIGTKRFGPKHEAKFVIGLFILSCIGLSQVLWGRRPWAIFGLIGMVAIIVWIIKKTLRRTAKTNPLQQ